MATALALFVSASPPPFEDRTAGSGVDVVLRNWATPQKHQIETMAGGVAVIDFDNDGRPDLFFTNGAEQPGLRKTSRADCNRLFRNLGNWKFEDVTERAGVCGEGYSIAAAAGDFDNDGYADLFVAGVDRNILYRNRGDGTFKDVTAQAGVGNRGRWAAGAGWFDYDNDGRLDLFVVNYVKWDPATEPLCGDPRDRSYCHPKFYEGLPNALFHNNGDGTFTDVSLRSGIAAVIGKGMSVAFADYDGDGRIDAFVANDTAPNFLFHNEGGGKFREVGLTAGIALNDDGRALSSMGSDFRPVDRKQPDLFVTALANETFPLFRNQGRGMFSDATYASRIGAATLLLSGWGAGIYDFDNDGRKDVFAACGDVQDNTERHSSRRSRQPNVLLLDRGGLKFEAREAGPPARHRGAAFADFDGNGSVDVVVTRIGESPALLRNRLGGGRHWLDVRLEGVTSNRDGLGAVVRLVTAAGEQWNQATTAVGYASASDRVVHFGLGGEKQAEAVEVLWPSGLHSRVARPAVDRVLTVKEGAN